VLLRTRHPQVCLLRQLHGCVRMRLRALGRSEVQPKVGGGFSGGFSGVRAHQTSVVEALGSAVQGSRGAAVCLGGGECSGRGACLGRAVRRSRSGLGTTLWLCCCKRKARQGASVRRRRSRLRSVGPRVSCREGGGAGGTAVGGVCS
jgi:hypothetical protein